MTSRVTGRLRAGRLPSGTDAMIDQYAGGQSITGYQGQELSKMAKHPLLVLGCGGNALDALETIQALYEIVAFIDDDPGRQAQVFERIPVLPRSALDQYPSARVISLIGSEKTYKRREEIIRSFGIQESRFTTIVHPNAQISRLARLGRDVIVFPGVTITSNAVIGNHIFILPQTVIHHDVHVEDYTIIGANVVLAGNARIGKSCYIGSSSSIRNGVKIGAGALIGMASNVIRDVPEGAVVAGNPARALR